MKKVPSQEQFSNNKERYLNELKNMPPAPKRSRTEIILGIMVCLCGFLFLFLIGVSIIGWILVGVGIVLFLIGIFSRRFHKWEMKMETGADQIAEADNGELIEVHEE